MLQTTARVSVGNSVAIFLYTVCDLAKKAEAWPLSNDENASLDLNTRQKAWLPASISSSLQFPQFDWAYILIVITILVFLMLICAIAICCARKCGVRRESVATESTPQGFTNPALTPDDQTDKPPAYHEVPFVEPPTYDSLQDLEKI